MRTIIVKYSLAVAILAVFALIIEGDFISASPFVIIGQLAGVALIISSRVAFRTEPPISANPGEGPLVQRGPYRVIRHPIYTGAILLIWSSILGHVSAVNLIIGVILLVSIVARISFEEQLLMARYPEYGEYARRTKRVIPFIY